MTTQEKFVDLKVQLNDRLVERHEIIDTMVLAIVARGHHFQIGSPGVAKSLGIRSLFAMIDGVSGDDYFEVLMTKFSNPEEIFGPLDLLALQGVRGADGAIIEQSAYRFQTEGYLPQAKIAFLDEIWKANAAILNALLMALNERLFRNAGHIGSIPLSSMFCASNEMPEGEELAALYDRIHFRHIARPIQEPGNFIRMMEMAHTAPEKVMSWEDVIRAQEEAACVHIPRDVIEALADIRNDLDKKENINPTDRRFHDTTRIIQAHAWLEGMDEAEVPNMHPLAHVLWSTPAEQPIVERMLLELANPLDKEALAIQEQIQAIAAELDLEMQQKDPDGHKQNKKGVELHGKVKRIKKDLAGLRAQVEKSGRKATKVDEAQQQLVTVTRRLLRDLFQLDYDAQEAKALTGDE